MFGKITYRLGYTSDLPKNTFNFVDLGKILLNLFSEEDLGLGLVTKEEYKLTREKERL